MKQTWACILTGILLLLAGLTACSGPREGPQPTPMDPVWRMDALVHHLSVFNDEDVEGRATGTEGYARVADYVASQMGAYMLQPALVDEYLLSYETSLNRIGKARLVVSVGADTLAFYPGIDFLPDRQTGAGAVSAQQVGLWPTGARQPPDERVVLMPAAKAESSSLRRAQQAGADAVLVVGALTPQHAAPSAGDALVVRVTPEASARLLSVSPAALEGLLDGETPSVWQLPRPLHLRVRTTFQPSAEAVNAIGVLAGNHPMRTYQAVLVCADLDGLGASGNVEAYDFSRFGLGAAALLEVARNYATFSPYGPVPERSIVFAVWSGSRQKHAGLRAYLKDPLWSLDSTRAVVYVGLSPDEQPAVERLLQEHQLPLYAIPPPDEPLYTPEMFLRPPLSVRRRARQERPEMDDIPNPNVEAVIERAALVADSMARATHERLLRETMTPAPFDPVDADTLPLPNGAP